MLLGWIELSLHLLLNIFISVWIHTFLCYSLSFTILLCFFFFFFICFAQIFSRFDQHEDFQVDCYIHLTNVYNLVHWLMLSISLLSRIVKYFRFNNIVLFLQALIHFNGEGYLKIMIQALNGFIFIGVSMILGPLNWQSKQIHMCIIRSICTHMHLFIYICSHVLSIYLWCIVQPIFRDLAYISIKINMSSFVYSNPAQSGSL